MIARVSVAFKKMVLISCTVLSSHMRYYPSQINIFWETHRAGVFWITKCSSVDKICQCKSNKSLTTSSALMPVYPGTKIR